jgi:hypothetical protein
MATAYHSILLILSINSGLKYLTNNLLNMTTPKMYGLKLIILTLLQKY